MKCPSCGARLSKGATFCHICYTVVGAPPAPPTASSAASTAASPPSVARPVPVTAIAPRPPRAAHRPRTARPAVAGGLAAALILVALLLTRPWQSGAAPGGAGAIPAIPPVQGDGGVGRWQLGDARVSVAQTPGCDEGPCPGTMAVRFSDGSTSSVDDEATISEIGQVDPTHYLAAAGFCYMNCILRVYAIDTAVRSVTTILNRAQPDATGKPSYSPMPQGTCGFTLTYRGATYTARAGVPDKKSSYYVTWLLYSGDKTCPSQSHNAGSSGAAGGASVVPPSPQSTAMAQATQSVAAPQDTQAPTAVLGGRGPSTQVLPPITAFAYTDLVPSGMTFQSVTQPEETTQSGRSLANYEYYVLQNGSDFYNYTVTVWDNVAAAQAAATKSYTFYMETSSPQVWAAPAGEYLIVDQGQGTVNATTSSNTVSMSFETGGSAVGAVNNVLMLRKAALTIMQRVRQRATAH